MNEKRRSWWATEADRAAWIEFVEANRVRNKQMTKGPRLTDELLQTLNVDYIIKNEPFKELPWQYFPKPKIDHRPPRFIYGFSLGDRVSELEHLGRVTGILKPEEAFTFRNFNVIMMRTMRQLEECGLSRKEFLSVDRCYSKTDANYVLETNYRPDHITPERLEHVIRFWVNTFQGGHHNDSSIPTF